MRNEMRNDSMKKNSKNNTKKTGMKVAVVMAAVLAAGTPFAIHSLVNSSSQNVKVVETNKSDSDEKISIANNSKTASTKENQKADDKTATASKSSTASQKSTSGTASQNSTASQKSTSGTTNSSSSSSSSKSSSSSSSKSSSSSSSKNSSSSSSKSSSSSSSKSSSSSSSKINNNTESATYTVASRNLTVYGTSETGVNIRSGADSTTKIIGTLGYRESVKVTGLVLKNGKDTGWYRVKYNNRTGYLSAKYVSTTQPKKITPESTDVVFNKTFYDMNGSGTQRTVTYRNHNNKETWSDSYGRTYTGMEEGFFVCSDGTVWTTNASSVNHTFVYSMNGGDEQRTVYHVNGTYIDCYGRTYTVVSESVYQCSDGTQWSSNNAYVVGYMDLYYMNGYGKVTVAVHLNGAVTDDYNNTYSQVSDTQWVSSNGDTFTTDPSEVTPEVVATLTIYSKEVEGSRVINVYADGSVYDSEGRAYTTVGDSQWVDSDGINWYYQQDTEVDPAEESQQEESQQVEAQQEETQQMEVQQTEEAQYAVGAETAEETQQAEGQSVEETTTAAEKIQKTVKVDDGYLALRNTAANDDSNEIGQLQNGAVVEVSAEELNSGKQFVYVYVPSTGMSGYVNASYLA